MYVSSDFMTPTSTMKSCKFYTVLVLDYDCVSLNELIASPALNRLPLSGYTDGVSFSNPLGWMFS